jgi:hypothetical protein
VQRSEAVVQRGHARSIVVQGVEPVEHRRSQRLRGRGVLQQLGHDEIAAQNVGQAHPGLQLLAAHEAPTQRVHVVANDHGALEQRRLQRGRAAGDQGHIAGREHGVRLATDHLHTARQARLHRPPARCAPAGRHRRHYHFDSWLRLLDKRCSLKKLRSDVPHLDGTAARQNGQYPVVMAPAPARRGQQRGPAPKE